MEEDMVICIEIQNLLYVESKGLSLILKIVMAI